MDKSIDDEVAIEFARGFYDAFATGHTIDFAIDEGKAAAKLKGLSSPPIRVITKTEK
jgi:hypothetical protein